ncbi:MAG: hypothetical protein JSR26_00645 [Proteobacteria bacterium]|nr:hypothetical protein [Pseudomonadota bacterium]
MLAPALLALVGAACASFQDKPADPAVAQRLAEVRAIAGPPVSSFRFMRMTTFEPIGLSNVMVFTAPQDAWLLQLDGSCRGLDFGPFMGLTTHMHRVLSGVDGVRVQDNPIPCRIVEIRRVDAQRLRHIDTEKAAPTQPDPGQPATPPSPPSG